ncbi:MAG: VOC family protein [Planctomycetota bacterium]|jgi:predicted enzyme related to lactoylglutathione lyase
MADTQAPPAAGTFCWHEIMTRDVASAKKFYGELFGWTATDRDMGPMGTYTIFHRGEEMVAGCMAMEGPHFEGVPPHWLTYLAVDDINASTDKAAAIGADVKVPPTEIPEVGHFSVIQDPAGAVVCFFQGLPC